MGYLRAPWIFACCYRSLEVSHFDYCGPTCNWFLIDCSHSYHGPSHLTVDCTVSDDDHHLRPWRAQAFFSGHFHQETPTSLSNLYYMHDWFELCKKIKEEKTKRITNFTYLLGSMSCKTGYPRAADAYPCLFHCSCYFDSYSKAVLIDCSVHGPSSLVAFVPMCLKW